MKTFVQAFAPATIANVSCGFDVFGMAVDAPGDVVAITRATHRDVRITAIHGDGGLLPTDAAKNTAGIAVLEFLRATGLSMGIDLELHKNLPLGSGMGSSAASAVAALVAINELAGNPLRKHELLPFAMEAERVACGAAHADNAAPSLLGGFVLIRHAATLDTVEIPVPPSLYSVVVHPHLEIKTRLARQVLRQSISLADATTQWANTAALVAGLMKPDLALVSRALQDVVAEPSRALLIPGFDAVKEAAQVAGALGCGISGSGPSLFALCDGADCAHRVALQMERTFHQTGFQCDTYVSSVNRTGTKVLYAT